MCGRYSQTQSPAVLAARFGLKTVPQNLAPRYNIAPSQDAPVIIEENGRRLELLRWGLIPAWSKDPAIGHKTINARSETLLERPSFKTPFLRSRCLVVADGFYEWKRLAAGAKTPLRAALPSRESFAMAGLWDRWKSPEGKDVRTFTIITTAPNDVMRPIHDRMPVILPRDAEGAWLDPKTPPKDLTNLLLPWAGQLEVYEVSPLVNSPRNESAACAEPIGK